MKTFKDFKVGDIVFIAGTPPQAKGEIVRFFIQGDQLHADDMEMVEVKILEAGHNTKKKSRSVYFADHHVWSSNDHTKTTA